MTEDQANEIMRLANMLARRRVRKYAVSVGHGPNETAAQTDALANKAKEELESYLAALVHKE